MSYAEAKADRKRRRRNENLSLILGLLGGVAQGFMGQKQRGQDAKAKAQAEALQREFEMDKQERKIMADQESDMHRNQTLLEMTKMQTERDRGGEGSIPEWRANAAGLVGDQDPSAVLKGFEDEITGYRSSKDYDPLFGDEPIKDKLKQRDAVRSLIGYNRLRGQGRQQQPSGPLPGLGGAGWQDRDQGEMPAPTRGPGAMNPTGTMNPTSTQAEPNAGAMHGQRQYGNLLQALRGAYAGGDQASWEMIRTVYPQLQIPPFYAARPTLFGGGPQQ